LVRVLEDKLRRDGALMPRLFIRYRRHKRLHVNFLGIKLIYTSVFYRYRKSIWLFNVTSALRTVFRYESYAVKQVEI